MSNHSSTTATTTTTLHTSKNKNKSMATIKISKKYRELRAKKKPIITTTATNDSMTLSLSLSLSTMSPPSPSSFLSSYLSLSTPNTIDIIPTDSLLVENDAQQEDAKAEAINADKNMLQATIMMKSSNNNSNMYTIVGPIIGLFAGIVFIASAMFLIVRNKHIKEKKKRQSTLTANKQDTDENVFHDISLIDDEAVSMKDSKHMSSSVVLIASRHQLQHQKPSLLEYKIESYTAQLADILDDEEDDDVIIFPFHHTYDISSLYNGKFDLSNGLK